MEDISIEELTSLIDRLPFGRRIDYLLSNQKLGSRKLTTSNHFSLRCDVYPNCFGTVLFLLEGDRDFIKKFRCQRAEGKELFTISKEGSFAVFPNMLKRPGSLEPEYMKLFLREMCKELQKPNIGSIVSTGGTVYDY